MPTPAVNEFESFNSDYENFYFDVVSQTWIPNGSGSAQSAAYARRRPESRSNPIRADWTRAPGYFFHRGFRAAAPLGTMEWEATPGATHLSVGVLSGTPGGWLLPSHDEKAWMFDQAMLKALLKCKDTKIQLGVSLAEAKKTAQFIGQNATRVATQVNRLFDDRLDRKLRKSFPSSWKKAPGWWLEYCYGAMPLLQDTYGAAEALAAMMSRGHALDFTSYGVTKDESPFALHNASGLLSSEYVAPLKSAVKIKLRFDLPSNLLQNLQAAGLTNPFETVWELVPYSFVLDWFIPVGKWISALDAVAYLHFKEGSASIIRRYKAEAVSTPGFPMHRLKRLAISRPGSYKEFHFERWPITSLPTIPPLPNLNTALNLNQVASGMALITQVLKKWF